MTDSLSPAVKAVDRAIADRIQLLGEVAPSRQVAAAALRAAADQVVPQGGPFLMTHSEDRVRHQLLSIAAELEGNNG